LATTANLPRKEPPGNFAFAVQNGIDSSVKA
jgi:hypothetical protein